MTTSPFKPKIIGLNHKPQSVLYHFASLKKYFRRGGTVWIECGQDDLESYLKNEPKFKFLQVFDLSGYGLIVSYALRNGMNVRALDGQRTSQHSTAIQTMFERHPDLLEYVHNYSYLSPHQFMSTLLHYQNEPLRERRWAKQLIQAGPDDIAIMHPWHAHRLAKKLGLPEQRVSLLSKIGIFGRAELEEIENIDLAPKRLAEVKTVLKEFRAKKIRGKG